jgi:hypothetical protein
MQLAEAIRFENIFSEQSILVTHHVLLELLFSYFLKRAEIATPIMARFINKDNVLYVLVTKSRHVAKYLYYKYNIICFIFGRN